MNNRNVQFVAVTALLIVMIIWMLPSATEGKYKDVSPQKPQEYRDAYSQSFVIDANSILFEVPEGRRFVLLRLYSRIRDYEHPVWGEHFWTLTIDGEMFLYGLALPRAERGDGAYAYTGDVIKEDFPDKCVVVNGGQTLGITLHEVLEGVNLTLIGYFCDAR